MSDYFEIAASKELKVIKLLGNLINKTWMDELIKETDNSIDQGVVNFIINLEDVELINSSGISMLVNILTKARRSGGDVILCCITNKVERLLLITKLNTIFTIKDNLPEAKEHFQTA